MMTDTKTAAEDNHATAKEWAATLIHLKNTPEGFAFLVDNIERILEQGRREAIRELAKIARGSTEPKNSRGGATANEELLAGCKVCVSTIDDFCKGVGMTMQSRTIHMRVARHLAQKAIERCENGE